MMGFMHNYKVMSMVLSNKSTGSTLLSASQAKAEKLSE